MATGAFDRVGSATDNTFDTGKDTVRGGINSVGDAAGAVGDRVGDRVNSMRRDENVDTSSDNSILKWLLPLILLGLLVALGFWFCGKSAPTTVVTNSNANANRTNTNTNLGRNANLGANVKAVDSSFSIKADNGKYTVSGVIPDEATKKQIVDALTAQYGAGNVNFDGLRVETSAKPFAAGWWDNFTKILPNLKDWKTGAFAFAGNGITQATGLPAAPIAQIKSLFSGWSLPLSIVGAEGATKQANEESLKALAEADSVEEVVKALNVSIINFDSANSTIPADAKPILAKAAEVFKRQTAGTSVEIGGYTDNQGNAEANKKLSQARAESVKKALVDLGVQDAMLKAVGYGDANPVGDNTTEDGRFKNRRIEYKTSDGTVPTATITTTIVNSNTTK
jgi:outer membrane protein OmpA-like peptidoglycan-associated protein